MYKQHGNNTNNKYVGAINYKEVTDHIQCSFS